MLGRRARSLETNVNSRRSTVRSLVPGLAARPSPPSHQLFEVPFEGSLLELLVTFMLQCSILRALPSP